MTMGIMEIEKILNEAVHIQVMYVLKDCNKLIDEDMLSKYAQVFNIHHWRTISIHFKLTESFIERFSDKLYWKDISLHQNLSTDFIKKHIHKLNWLNISKKQVLSECFIVENMDQLNMVEVVKKPLSEDFIINNWEHFTKEIWDNISIHQKLSEKVIDMFADFLNWQSICKYQKLSEAFLEKYSNKVFWLEVCSYQHLSKQFIDKFYKEVDEFWEYITKGQEHLLYEIDFIKKYADKIDWYEVTDLFVVNNSNQPNTCWSLMDEKTIEEIGDQLGEEGWEYVAVCEQLSEPFIEKHLKLNNLNKKQTTYNQRLSEKFIDKMHKYLDWECIGSPHHKLSFDFIEKWEENINWSTICEFQSLSEEFMEKFFDNLDWEKVAQYQNLSIPFVVKNKQKINIDKLKDNEKMSQKQIQNILLTLGVVDALT